MTIRIVDWDEHYESAESRKIKHLGWVKVPNDIANVGYIHLVTGHPDGMSHFGIWVGLLQIASRRTRRICGHAGGISQDTRRICGYGRDGILRQGGNELGVFEISLMLHVDRNLVEDAIIRLAEIGWIECDSTFSDSSADSPGTPADSPRTPGEDGIFSGLDKTRQDKTRQEKTKPRAGAGARERALPAEPACPLEEIAALWAETCGAAGLPQLQDGIPRGLRATVRARWREHPDLEAWQQQFARVAASAFLRGESTDFQASLAWVVGPRNWAKIEAGSYAGGNGTASHRMGAGIMEGMRRAALEDGAGPTTPIIGDAM